MIKGIKTNMICNVALGNDGCCQWWM